MIDIEHVPQIVTVDRFSDEQLMRGLAEFTRSIRADCTVGKRRRQYGPAHALNDAGSIMLVDAWRRGLLDSLLLGHDIPLVAEQ